MSKCRGQSISSEETSKSKIDVRTKTTTDKNSSDRINKNDNMNNETVPKRQSLPVSTSDLSTKMRLYMFDTSEQRRQSLPPDIGDVINYSSPQLTSRHLHLASSPLSPTIEAYSCPGTPRRESISSLQVTPHLTPSTSVSSFVSSLDGESDYRDLSGSLPGSYRDTARRSLDMLGEEGDIPSYDWGRNVEHAKVCYDIEQYLKSLEDVDYLDLSEPISPVSLEGIKLDAFAGNKSSPFQGDTCSSGHVTEQGGGNSGSSNN